MNGLSANEIEMLVRMIIHDLEKPLAVTGRVLQRLEQGRLDPRQEDHARLIRASSMSVRRSRRMLSDLAEVISHRRLPVYPRRVRLAELTESIAEEFLPLAQLEGHRFLWQCTGDGWYFTDPDLVARIAENFLVNALNHNKRDMPIRMTLNGADPAGFGLSVENRGDAIPPDRLETIFEPGEQLHLRKERIWRGHGLGLAFCRLAAEALHGRVWVANLPEGDGVAFNLVVSGADAAEIESQI